MGEEKPDEELMGKRKSSPRLSPTPLGAGTIIVALNMENIRSSEKIIRRRYRYPIGLAGRYLVNEEGSRKK